MRELPKPDAPPEEARNIGLKEMPYSTAALILAIQKQAYEDGLRDALKVVERYEHLHEYNPEFEQRRDIEAMLTASQEKK